MAEKRVTLSRGVDLLEFELHLRNVKGGWVHDGSSDDMPYSGTIDGEPTHGHLRILRAGKLNRLENCGFGGMTDLLKRPLGSKGDTVCIFPALNLLNDPDEWRVVSIGVEPVRNRVPVVSMEEWERRRRGR